MGGSDCGLLPDPEEVQTACNGNKPVVPLTDCPAYYCPTEPAKPRRHRRSKVWPGSRRTAQDPVYGQECILLLLGESVIKLNGCLDTGAGFLAPVSVQQTELGEQCGR